MLYSFQHTVCWKEYRIGMAELIEDEMSRNIIAAAEQIAVTKGAGEVNVRKILRTLGITNRVFYNRFHNIDEVLTVVYRQVCVRMRESIISKFDPQGDFFGQIVNIVADTLTLSYRFKMGLNQFVFANDSSSSENYAWWKEEIKRLIELGKERGLVRELDENVMSYAIWCFIRGYNADALARNLPEEEAVSGFRYSFSVLLEGMKA